MWKLILTRLKKISLSVTVRIWNVKIAPLKQAEDAVLVDSSDMTIEEVVDAIVAEFEKVK